MVQHTVFVNPYLNVFESILCFADSGRVLWTRGLSVRLPSWSLHPGLTNSPHSYAVPFASSPIFAIVVLRAMDLNKSSSSRSWTSSAPLIFSTRTTRWPLSSYMPWARRSGTTFIEIGDDACPRKCSEICNADRIGRRWRQERAHPQV